jgi:hypothetical protein
MRSGLFFVNACRRVDGRAAMNTRAAASLWLFSLGWLALGGCGRGDVDPWRPQSGAGGPVAAAPAELPAAGLPDQEPAVRPPSTDEVEVLAAARSKAKDGILADELAHGDQRGDWDTEAFHEATKERLHLLEDLLRSPAGVSEAKLAELLTDDFRTTELRPPAESLEEAAGDARLRIVRAAGDYRPRESHRGRDGLLRALADLAAAFPDRGSIESHFKIYRVELAGPMGEAQMYVDTDGQDGEDGPQGDSSGGVQQNMAWHTTWRLDDRNAWRLASLELRQFEEVRYRGPHGKLFSDCTASILARNDCFKTQLLPSIDHWRLRLEESFGMDAAALTGMAVADVNGDGLDDVYFVEMGGLPNRLFVQQPDGTAVDRSAESGVDWLDRGHAALFADFDNDGDQDLVLGVGPLLLFLQNDGQGRFERVAELKPNPTAYALAAADYDNDGWLDLYACSYGNNYESFADSVAPLPWHDANNGAPNSLFRNRGGWKFEDVTQRVGLDENNRRFSFASSWEDFDNDGDQDLYVANDFGRNNLYVNDINRSGRFHDAAPKLQVEDIGSGMSVSWGDYNNDGRMDLWVGNMFSGAGNRIAFQDRFRDGVVDDTVLQLRRFARGNSLFRNRGDGPLEDQSVEAGVTMTRWAWSSLMTDLNNDGWQDLLAANGYITGIQPDDL